MYLLAGFCPSEPQIATATCSSELQHTVQLVGKGHLSMEHPGIRVQIKQVIVKTAWVVM
jgi:hypothetical protein